MHIYDLDLGGLVREIESFEELVEGELAGSKLSLGLITANN